MIWNLAFCSIISCIWVCHRITFKIFWALMVVPVWLITILTNVALSKVSWPCAIDCVRTGFWNCAGSVCTFSILAIGAAFAFHTFCPQFWAFVVWGTFSWNYLIFLVLTVNPLFYHSICFFMNLGWMICMTRCGFYVVCCTFLICCDSWWCKYDEYY